MAIPFLREFSPDYGSLVAAHPAIALVRRVVARNPSPFTAWGTGTYVIGHGEVAVVDPGPADEAHVAALVAGLKGETVTHILVTHTHIDHSPGVPILLRSFPHAKTYGFGRATEEIDADVADAVKIEEGGDTDFVPDIRLKDGDRIVTPQWEVEALHTPGHMSNHMCYALKTANALFSGDHVMGWSTTVVSPPDGNMAHYMQSLEKLIQRASSGIDASYFPTHGAPITEVPPFLAAYKAHRLERETMIVTRLAAGDTKIAEMVRVIYKDVDARLHPAAARSVLAHLQWLVEKGRVQIDGALSVHASFALV